MSTNPTHDDLRNRCSKMARRCEMIFRMHGADLEHIQPVKEIQSELQTAEQVEHIEGTERHFTKAWEIFVDAYDERTRKTTLESLLDDFEDSGVDLAE